MKSSGENYTATFGEKYPAGDNYPHIIIFLIQRDRLCEEKEREQQSNRVKGHDNSVNHGHMQPLGLYVPEGC